MLAHDRRGLVERDERLVAGRRRRDRRRRRSAAIRSPTSRCRSSPRGGASIAASKLAASQPRSKRAPAVAALRPPLVQPREERLVAHLRAQPAGVLEQRLGQVEAGHRRIGVQRGGRTRRTGRGWPTPCRGRRSCGRARAGTCRPSIQVLCCATTSASSGIERAAGLPASSRLSTAMKWLLPLPKLPCR